VGIRCDTVLTLGWFLVAGVSVADISTFTLAVVTLWRVDAPRVLATSTVVQLAFIHVCNHVGHSTRGVVKMWQ